MNADIFKAGFWITPHGKFFRVTTHIEEICRAPGQFGLDNEELLAVFERYSEKFASEGTAREQVILRLVANGWIRVRHYADKGWTVNVSDLAARNRGIVAAFFREIYHDEPDYTPVHLDYPRGKVELEARGIVELDLLLKSDEAPLVTRICGPQYIPEKEIVPVSLLEVLEGDDREPAVSR